MLAFRKLRQKRIIHRDVKPENILLDEFGRPIVGDYGLARQFGRSAEEQPWRLEQQWAHGEAEDEAAHRVGTDHARALVGTSRYVAPEQWKGEAYSYEVDVWAFGIMLYYMMFGKVRLILLRDSLPLLTRRLLVPVRPGPCQGRRGDCGGGPDPRAGHRG